MKGLVLLFLTMCFSLIAWGYMDKQSKQNVKALVKGNLFAIIFASIAVAIAIAVSTNTTLRLV